MNRDEGLRIFLTVANAGSLSVAARILSLAQPTVSRKIKELEAEFGSLFRRHGRGVALTSAGAALKHSLDTHYLAIDDICQSFLGSRKALPGLLKIAAVHTLNGYFLPDLVKAYAENHPEIRLQIMGRSSEEVVSLVETGEADIGFVYDVMVNTDALEMTRLHSESMTLIHHPDLMPVLDKAGCAILDKDYPLVGYPKNYAMSRILKSALPHPLNIAVEVETLDLLLAIARQKIAGAIIPKELPAAMVEETGLIKTPLAGDEIIRHVTLIRRKTEQTRLDIMQAVKMATRIS